MNDVLEVGRGDFRGGDISGEDLVRKVFEGQVLPPGGPVIRESRDLFWDEKTTVRSKTFEYNLLKGELQLLVSVTFIVQYAAALTS